MRPAPYNIERGGGKPAGALESRTEQALGDAGEEPALECAREAHTLGGALAALTLAVARSLRGAREAQKGRWTGPAEAKVSWTGPAEAKGSWTGPAEAQVSWTGPAEAQVSWTGPAEAKVSWTGPAEAKVSCTGPAEAQVSWTGPAWAKVS